MNPPRSFDTAEQFFPLMVNLLVIGPFILYDTLAPVAIRSMYLISSDLLKLLVFSIMPSMLFDITKRTP